jgi:hypothetical protein
MTTDAAAKKICASLEVIFSHNSERLSASGDIFEATTPLTPLSVVGDGKLVPVVMAEGF